MRRGDACQCVTSGSPARGERRTLEQHVGRGAYRGPGGAPHRQQAQVDGARARQEVDGAGEQHAVGRAQPERQRGQREQPRQVSPAAGVAHGRHVGDDGGGRRRVAWRVRHPEPVSNLRHLLDVPVVVARRETRAVHVGGGERAVDERGVDIGQEVRIVGRVGRAARVDAADRRVYGPDPADRDLRFLVVAVRHARDEGDRRLVAVPRVAGDGGVHRDRGGNRRVPHLQEERPQPGREHGGRRMELPRHSVRTQQSVVALHRHSLADAAGRATSGTRPPVGEEASGDPAAPDFPA